MSDFTDADYENVGTCLIMFIIIFFVIVGLILFVVIQSIATLLAINWLFDTEIAITFLNTVYGSIVVGASWAASKLLSLVLEGVSSKLSKKEK
jgi:hypothetical protein